MTVGHKEYAAKQRTREMRLDAWVATASFSFPGTRFPPNMGGGWAVPPDTRTPIERLHAMIEAGKKVGVDLDEDFIADVKARLPAA